MNLIKCNSKNTNTCPNRFASPENIYSCNCLNTLYLIEIDGLPSANIDNKRATWLKFAFKNVIPIRSENIET